MKTVAILALGIGMIAACGDAAAPGPRRIDKGTRMTAASLSSCETMSAAIHLVPEQLMTRARLTEQTVADRYPAVTIGHGDPRLAKLTAALRGLSVEAAAGGTFDPRLLVRLQCKSGATVTILGSATDAQGHMQLSVNGDIVSSSTPFRKQVEALVG